MHNKVLNLDWIKAHVGLSGNKRAGYFAKSVIETGFLIKKLISSYQLVLLKCFKFKKLSQNGNPTGLPALRARILFVF